MHYFWISVSVIMFGCMFWTNDLYQKKCGSGLTTSLRYTFFSSSVGLIALFVINGFAFEFTPFTFLMALLTALNGFGFTFCSFKALGSINLSLYSLFSMLGGMVLPFLAGIIFFGEDLTLAKAICLTVITAALLLTVKRGEKRGGFIYYAGIFILNGMSGVLTKTFTAAPFEKTSAAGYSILSALITAVISGVICLVLLRKKPPVPFPLSAIPVAAAGGIIHRIANYLLVISLVHVHASVQYPMVTGGTMIVSTVIAAFGKQKPERREILAVILSFIAILLLVIIPI